MGNNKCLIRKWKLWHKMSNQLPPSSHMTKMLPWKQKRKQGKRDNLWPHPQQHCLFLCRLSSARGAATSQKIGFQDPQSRLTRESITSVTVHRPSPKPTPNMEHRQGATPTSLGSGGGLFAPSQPSPLSHSITTRSPLVSSTTSSSSSPSSQASGTRKNIFSTAVASEIIEAARVRVMTSALPLPPPPPPGPGGRA